MIRQRQEMLESKGCEVEHTLRKTKESNMPNKNISRENPIETQSSEKLERFVQVTSD